MAPSRGQTELQLSPAPRERTLEFVILSALGDPGVVPCPVCHGHLDERHYGVECADCGAAIQRVLEPQCAERDNLIAFPSR